MAKHEDPALNTNAPPPSAEELRMTMLKRAIEKSEKEKSHSSGRGSELERFAASFLKEQVSSNEIALVRRSVMLAVENGAFEALVYSFPSDLCTDSGRAINNGDPEWPDTLQGKAKQLYDRYLANAKPQGFKLKAMVINFPGGMPGDIGFFLDWRPQAK